MTEPTEYPIPLPVTPKMADRMRAAGWRPPARVITTADELDELGEGVVILDDAGDVKQRTRGLWWLGPDWPGRVALPATVLWEPSE